MIRPPGSTLIGLLTAPLLILTACGSDDGGDATTNPVESSDASESTSGSDEESREGTAPDPADVEIAEAALLTLADFPVGWEAVPADEDDEDDLESQRKMAACVGVDHDELYDDSNAEAESPSFTNEDDEEITVEVTVDATEQEMTEAFAIAAGPTFRECVADTAREAMKDALADGDSEGAEIGDITLNEVSLGAHGDQTIAFRMTIPIEVEGLSLEANAEFGLVRVGRAMTYLTSTRFSFGSLSTEDFVGYVELATQRLEGALAGTV